MSAKRKQEPENTGEISGSQSGLSDALQATVEEVSDVSGGADTDQREAAATQYRHWVRINRVCNQRCMFCLDTDAQDGSMLDAPAVKEEIKQGFKGPGGRLIISGGEASIHPEFLSFIAYGREVGFEHIQTITNGRMYAYKEFVTSVLDAGLKEITFSMHGHTAELHDMLTGTPGSFVQALRGLRNVMADGRAIVNVDVVINKQNYQQLDDILAFYQRLGIHEFDLLQIIPFGRAWPQNRDKLFYNVSEGFPHLNKAFQRSRDPRNFIWTNRFPVQFLENLEDLIQDPHKLHDEVRGRRAQFDAFLREGQMLSCHGERCEYCFIDDFCHSLFATKDRAGQGIKELAVDLTGRHGASDYNAPAPGLSELQKAIVTIDRDKLQRLHLEAADLQNLREGLEALASSLPEDLGLSLAFDRLPPLEDLKATLASVLPAATLERVASTDAGAVLLPYIKDANFALELRLTKGMAAFALKHRAAIEARGRAGGLCFGLQPRSLVSRVASMDVDARRFLGAWKKASPQTAVTMSGFAPCYGLTPDPEAPKLSDLLWLDLLDEGGVISPHRYVEWYIRHGYEVKSHRCDDCIHSGECRGMPINYVRHYGFKQLEPVNK